MTNTQCRFSKDQMLAVVNASPAAVAAHDKSQWLGLFSRQGIVEDPVGSAAHVRKAGLQAVDPLDPFYETFIAPNDIRFEVERDLVCGRSSCLEEGGDGQATAQGESDRRCGR